MQNAELTIVKASVTCRYQWTLKAAVGLICTSRLGKAVFGKKEGMH
jgi:hypothetical protein